MEIEQKESREETLKGFGVYHVDGAEYNVDEDVFFKEIFKLEAEIKALRDGIVEFLTWMKKTQRLSIEAITAIDQLILKNEG